MITFPFGAITLRVISSPRSVVPLTSIVVEPSTPLAVIDNPLVVAVVAVTTVLVGLALPVDDVPDGSEELTATDSIYAETVPCCAETV